MYFIRGGAIRLFYVSKNYFSISFLLLIQYANVCPVESDFEKYTTIE